MNTKDIENAINHITTLQERLCCAENNLQYIKRLQNTESIVGIFNISNCFEKININSMRTIIVSGGLNSIIESLKNRPTYHQLQYTMRN